MDIQIARQYKDVEFTDDELVFMGLMTALGEYSGFDTQYTVCANDLMRIMGRPSMTAHCDHMEKLNTIFKIGHVNNFNWTISWRKTDKTFYNRIYNGLPRTAQIETKILTEMDAKLNWAFLMGKLTNMEYNVREWTEYAPHEQGEHMLDPKIVKGNLKGWYPTRRF